MGDNTIKQLWRLLFIGAFVGVKCEKRQLWRLLFIGAFVGVKCEKRESFTISKTWDNKPIDHDPCKIRLSPHPTYVLFEVDAPYFHDPPPPNGERGKPYKQLWDYEVVEAFFLGREEKYLEVEFNPHGQHLVLFLSGRKNAIKMCMPIDYIASIGIRRWQAFAKIPKTYFPPNVTMMNAYAIHGTGENRVYEALYPVPSNHFDGPDFHRLEFFRKQDFSLFLPPNNIVSEVWKEALFEASNDGKVLACPQD